jgi:hypothetical protein
MTTPTETDMQAIRQFIYHLANGRAPKMDHGRRQMQVWKLPEHVVDWVLGADYEPPAPQPAPAAQVLPVQAVVTQAPAWLVVADGRTIATFGNADDAHAYRRWLNRSTTGVEVGS